MEITAVNLIYVTITIGIVSSTAQFENVVQSSKVFKTSTAFWSRCVKEKLLASVLALAD